MKKMSKKQKKHRKARKNSGKRGLPRVSPPEIDLLFVTAARFYEAGKKKEAKFYLNKVVKLIPDHHEALNIQGLIAAENGLYGDAVEYYKRAIASNNKVASY